LCRGGLSSTPWGTSCRGWSARLEAVGRSGAGQYAIALGGQVQITEIQNAGPYVPIAGATPLDWQMLATQRFSILARAWLSQGGATAVQLVNFTAELMAKLHQQTFYCGVSQLYDNFSGYCNNYATGFGDVELGFITTHPLSQARIDPWDGNPPPSVFTRGRNGYGGAFLNLSSWIDGLPATGGLLYSILRSSGTNRHRLHTAELLHRCKRRREAGLRSCVLHIC
jgi:hypothetical protein